MKVSAVIVTYNRLDLLKECLCAVKSQSFPVEHILVVDNASDIETQNYLNGMKGEIDYIRLDQNKGGAGGFEVGLNHFYEHTNDDFVWIMDDDTIPNDSTLEKLMMTVKEVQYFGFLASNVVWKDGSPAVMNIPVVDSRHWLDNMLSDSGLIRVSNASFVSLLVPRSVVKQYGLPIGEYFIWGDDFEYTSRLSRKLPCFFVSDSVVMHKMKQNKGVDIFEEGSERVSRYFYTFRNSLFTARQESHVAFIKRILIEVKIAVQLLFSTSPAKWKKMLVLIKGLLAGLVFYPKIKNVK